MSLRRSFVLVFLAVAMVLLWGCGGAKDAGKVAKPEEAKQPQTAPASAQKEPIKIGLLIEETGAFAWYGTENAMGAQLFVDELNSKGGIKGAPLKLITYNTESNPEKAIVGFKKLRDDEKVVAIVGLGLISEANAASPLVKEGGPLTYVLSGAYKPQNKYEFGGTVFMGDMQYIAVSKLKGKGISKVALLSTNDATGQATKDALSAVAQKLGIEIVATETFNPADVDVTAQLGRIMQSKPQAILAWLVGKPMGVVLKNVQQLGITVPIVTSHGNITAEFLKTVSSFQIKELYIPATKDIVWDQLDDKDPQKAVNKPFYENYKAKFGKEPGLGSGTGYDAVWLISKAIEAVGTNSDDMVKYIESIQGFNGVVGSYNFSSTDHRGLDAQDAVVTRLENGKLKIVKE